MDRESAISRNIVLALVVSVAIIVVVVAIVMVLFPPHQDVVPRFNANIERSGNLVYIYHDGGDPLQKSRTAIRINGQVITPDSLSFLHAQDWPWTPGKTLRIQYNGQGTPDLVEVVYVGNSAQTVIFSSRAEGTPETPLPITTLPISPGPTTPVAPATTATPAVTSTGTITPSSTGPLAPQPPVPSFTGTPRSGQFPLYVQFTDRSSGAPSSWLWNFGDGQSSNQQNPSHTYQNPGTYSVTLTVGNQYGTNQVAEQDFIAAGSVPVANFMAVPAEGFAPLTVQFNDISSGAPTAWEWNFGDMTTSTLRNPQHTYPGAGSYTVSLTVTNAFGSQTRIQSDAVRVNALTREDIYLTGSRSGTISPGYLLFWVNSTGGSIKIAGSTISFSSGDAVQLFVDESQNGVIDVNANGITAFKFDDVRMFVNGEFVREGTVSAIRIPGYSGLRSTFSITIPAGDTNMVLYVSGNRILPPDGASVIISNLGVNSEGQMNLAVKTSSLEYRGGADGYRLG
jgi:PKD repeat protein